MGQGTHSLSILPCLVSSLYFLHTSIHPVNLSSAPPASPAAIQTTPSRAASAQAWPISAAASTHIPAVLAIRPHPNPKISLTSPISNPNNPNHNPEPLTAGTCHMPSGEKCVGCNPPDCTCLSPDTPSVLNLCGFAMCDFCAKVGENQIEIISFTLFYAHLLYLFFEC